MHPTISYMENDYQISKDGTIFQILEDGTISKLAKIENGKVIASGESAPSENNTTGKGVLIFFLVAFAIATLVLGILYSQANDNYYSALSREYALEQKVSTLEESVTTLQEQLTQNLERHSALAIRFHLQQQRTLLLTGLPPLPLWRQSMPMASSQPIKRAIPQLLQGQMAFKQGANWK